MKTVQKNYYVCEICGRTSQKKETIEECRASHRCIMEAQRAIEALRLDGGLEISGNPRRVAEFFEGLDAGITALQKLVEKQKRTMDFGNILKNERQKKGVTQQQLADLAGVTKRAIAYWERGERDMTISNADKVFKALHVTVRIGE